MTYAAADPNRSNKAGIATAKRIGPDGWKTATKPSVTKLVQNVMSAPDTNRLTDFVRRRAYSHPTRVSRQRANVL